MRSTKTITVGIDWLSEIDGLSVENAIKYLSTLDQSYTLSYTMEGDTHGCEVYSVLQYDVQKTDREMFNDLKNHYQKRISKMIELRNKYLNRSNSVCVSQCDTELLHLNTMLSELKQKYNME